MEKTVKNKKKSEITRERILEAASQVIAQEGIEEASLALIAKKAKTVPSHIAHYYPKKADLFLHVMNYILDHLINDVTVARAREDLPATEKIVEIIRANFEYFEKKPHYYKCYVLSYYYAGIRKDFAAFHGKNYRSSIENTYKILKEVSTKLQIDTPEEKLQTTAKSVFNELEGGLIYYFFTDHNLTLEQYLVHHLDGYRLKFKALFGT